MDDLKGPALLELLTAADHRLVRTVDSLPVGAYAEPSGLPGWTRGHVVAHLALNAEALTAVLLGIAQGDVPPMYESQERRDADIDELAAADPAELRARLMGSTTGLVDAIGLVPDDRLHVMVERTRGSDRTFPAHTVTGMRLREVEIHHADLAADYTPTDWPLDVAMFLVASLVDRPAEDGSFAVAPTEIGVTWQGGPSSAGRVVSGTAADLGWWLTGRGNGRGLTSSDGTLPRMEAW
ncbi:maleylpyruvate isomerase [Nocardioides psychrotolerans]|uniref:Maleylpyruvate isomerase n=1 Tax=Nocardioides psychrotolerans TaxID=1005945 RepID=A0A1I3J8H2_9ACTN|nr:maleylpyruvate isomerase family mycothiol-dependent enzyme [Nocardioides psychrotolerans]GEP38239.1 maleylpyruvate isomerase [Nocardioides psychrotolerans]SFI56499.1 maleylpyruvate isomerase [Nocardioides psychrotolerans]